MKVEVLLSSCVIQLGHLQSGCSKKVENIQRKCLNPATVTLTCEFIGNGTPSWTFIEECFTFFSGKLFHKVALTKCKGYLFVW